MSESTSTWLPLPSQYLPTPCTTLAFDPISPLMFAGFQSGTITSYFTSPTTGLSGRYTSYKAHWGQVGLTSIDKAGILSVGGGVGAGGAKGGSIKMANRRGVSIWSIDTDPSSVLSTFAFTPQRSSEIIATGPNSNLFIVNVNRGSIIRSVGSLYIFLSLIIPVADIHAGRGMITATTTSSNSSPKTLNSTSRLNFIWFFMFIRF